MDASSYTVGSPIAQTFVLRDNAGAPILGATAADFALATAFALPSGDIRERVTIAETGDGEYQAVFYPNQAAWWGLRLLYTVGGLFRETLGTFPVGIAAAAGEVIDDVFVVRTGANTPVLGLIAGDFTTVEAYDTDTPSRTALTWLTPLEEGGYALSFRPSTPGPWTAHTLITTAGITREFLGQYAIGVAGGGGVAIDPLAMLGTSRLQLRRDILKDLGDLRILQATSDGDNVSIIDHESLIGEPGAYAGRETLFVGGTVANLGQVRYVTGSSQQRRALGFGVPLPAITRLGDEAELVNFRGVGYRIQDVHEGINRVIRAVRDRALVNVPLLFPTYAPGTALPLPAHLRTVEEVQWTWTGDGDAATTQRVRGLRKASRPNGYGWWVDPASRTLNISGSAVAWPAVMGSPEGATLVVWGLGRPSELFADQERTPIDPEYLVMAVQAELARSKYLARPTPETERTMFMLNQMAGALRIKVATRRGPMSEDLT